MQCVSLFISCTVKICTVSVPTNIFIVPKQFLRSFGTVKIASLLSESMLVSCEFQSCLSVCLTRLNYGYHQYYRSRGSSVSIVSDYRLDDRGSISDRGRVFFFYPPSPGRIWGPSRLLSNGYRGPFPRWIKRGRGVMLTTHPHLVPRSRMSRSYTSSHPTRLHGV
jgi:hypothetical protein